MSKGIIENKQFRSVLCVINICVLEFILCCISNSDIFIYLYLITAAVFIVLSPVKSSLLLLIALTHFEFLITLPINWELSFHFILVGIFIVKAMILIKYPTKEFCIFIVMIVYMLLSVGNESMRYIKVLANYFVLFLAVIIYKKEDGNKYIISYTYGHMLSTCCSIFALHSTRMLHSLHRVYMNVNGIRILRFSGIDFDTNFYAMNCLMIISVLMILCANTKNNRAYKLLLGVYSCLGIMTFSKMFMLVYASMIALFCLLNFRRRSKEIFFSVLAIGIMVIVIDYSTNHQLSKMIFTRFFRADSLDSLTSGRLDLWIMYIQTFFDDIRKIIFGAGLANKTIEGSQAPHNTYIEVIYTFGVVGTTLLCVYIVTLYRYLKHKWGYKKMKIRCFPMYTLALSCMSLGVFCFDYTVYMILIVYICLLGFDNISYALRIK